MAGYTKTGEKLREDGLPKKTWLKQRLSLLAELRGAPDPSSDALKAFASALKGFSDTVIEEACLKLERTPKGEYENPMPTLAAVEQACRDASQVRTPPKQYEFWQCEKCKNQVAATNQPAGGCQNCGSSRLILVRSREVPFDKVAYMADVRAHPENYVSVADCIREVISKRKQQGKPTWNFVDPRTGDAV